ncbi:MAG: hypothetical protein KDD82_03250 [Planctomycetes bacterium]|nr:hypothetical protein [Planctomycetota bacterium]
MKRSQRFLLTLVPVVCLPVYLTAFHAEPGRLSLAHAKQPTLHAGLDRCDQCHTPTGIDPGCLACHKEIGVQLERGRGYHHHLASTQPEAECATCHSEHRGEAFAPLNANSWPEGRDGFRHPHLEAFVLDAGRHREVMGECERCHTRAKVDALPSPDVELIASEETFLGLDTDCHRCHEDPHHAGFSDDCLACHDQAQWKEASSFDHARAFPLEGAHTPLRCDQCHLAEVETDPVGPTQGAACSACHQDPHLERPNQAVFSREDPVCASCHSATSFTEAASLTYARATHAPRTFPLAGRHLETACRSCHARPEDPSPAAIALPASLEELRQEACARCHVDVHTNPTSGIVQLDTREGCQSCHDVAGWKPTLYQREEHAKTGFALSGVHAGVDCVRCHTGVEAVRLASEPIRSCEDCHQDQSPHRAAFAEGCNACHDTERPRWRGATLSAPQHRVTGFALVVPHDLECARCHAPELPFAERYPATAPEDCRGCHSDPHLGQFDRRSKPADCRTCHDATRWQPSLFGVEQHAATSYPLVGGHAAAACTDCHRRFRRQLNPDESVIYRRFRGQSRECKSCHESPHGGQFADVLADASADCTACHSGEVTWAIPDFDHTATRFPLGAAHLDVSCSRCHTADPERPKQGRRYRPLDPSCANCHADPHAGQFLLDDPQLTDAGRCERCHTQDTLSWKPRSFDHSQTRFPLDGAHDEVACAACHRPYQLRDGRTVVRFRPLGTSCKDCHGSFTRPDER